MHGSVVAATRSPPHAIALPGAIVNADRRGDADKPLVVVYTNDFLHACVRDEARKRVADEQQCCEHGPESWQRVGRHQLAIEPAHVKGKFPFAITFAFRNEGTSRCRDGIIAEHAA